MIRNSLKVLFIALFILSTAPVFGAELKKAPAPTKPDVVQLAGGGTAACGQDGMVRIIRDGRQTARQAKFGIPLELCLEIQDTVASKEARRDEDLAAWCGCVLGTMPKVITSLIPLEYEARSWRASLTCALENDTVIAEVQATAGAIVSHMTAKGPLTEECSDDDGGAQKIVRKADPAELVELCSCMFSAKKHGES